MRGLGEPRDRSRLLLDLHVGSLTTEVEGDTLIRCADVPPRSLEARHGDGVKLLSRSTWLIWRQRLSNRLRDALAVIAGYCNHKPYNQIPGESGGGYAHWRCAYKRGHDGVHRVGNYTWDDTGATTYDPIPVGKGWPAQPRTRHMILTRRQQRRRDASDERRRQEFLSRKRDEAN